MTPLLTLRRGRTLAALGCGIFATLAASTACKSSRDRSGVPGVPAPAVPPASPVPDVRPTAAAPIAPRTTRHTIHIHGFKFEPKDVTVAPGDSVVWVNDDAVPHTATLDGGAWSSPELAPLQSFVLVARVGGPYHCEAHKVMRGSLTVKAK